MKTLRLSLCLQTCCPDVPGHPLTAPPMLLMRSLARSYFTYSYSSITHSVIPRNAMLKNQSGNLNTDVPLSSILDYSSFCIKLSLVFALTTPPTPKAGTIRPIRAKAQTAQFFVTWTARSRKPNVPFLLKRSRPNRCRGVLNTCIAAGARNCAVFVRPASVLSTLENFSFTLGGSSARRGAMIVGRLKDAKIVRLSLHAKSA